MVVVGLKHFCRHCFSETSTACDTAETIPSKQCGVNNFYQSGLVNILTIADSPEPLVPFIDVYTHNALEYLENDIKPMFDAKIQIIC